MNSYFGLGIDAELSLDFHQAREDDPDKFTSRWRSDPPEGAWPPARGAWPPAQSHLLSPARFHNKGVYVKAGLQKLSRSRSLHRDLQLQVDNRDVPLPPIEGLIFLNIPR